MSDQGKDENSEPFEDAASGNDGESPVRATPYEAATDVQSSVSELEAVFDVPVHISAVLGRASVEVSELLRLDRGTVLELDRKVGEAIDIFVNDRLVARGEVVMVEDRLGVTMTEIIKADRT